MGNSLTSKDVVAPADYLKHISVCILVSMFLIVVGFLFFASPGRDDAHITYWAAYALSNFSEILNYNGLRIEQSSSLLQVLLLALTHKLTSVEMVTLGKISSVLFGALSVVTVYIMALKVDKRIAAASALLCSSNVYFIYWSYGGLESTLFTLLSLLIVISYSGFLQGGELLPGKLTAVVVLTLLFASVRPEAPIVLICLIIGLFAASFIKGLAFNVSEKGKDTIFRADILMLAGIVMVSILLLFAFRLFYFGQLFPQPVYAKSAAISLAVMKRGVLYLKSHLLYSDIGSYALTLLAAAGTLYAVWQVIKTDRRDNFIMISLLFFVSYLSFIILSGGDWMEGGRFLVPLVPFASIFIALLLNRVIRSRLVFYLIVSLLVIIQMNSLYVFNMAKSTGIPADERVEFIKEIDVSGYSWFEMHNKANVRDIPTIHYLKQVIEEVRKENDGKIMILSGQMGMIPYHIAKQYYSKVNFIDRFGLTDRVFTSCRTTNSLTRNTQGLSIGYDYFFENIKELESSCGLGRPDIVFDHSAEYADSVSRYGYKIVYFQRGDVDVGINGADIPAEQFIAVKDDLVTVGLERPLVFDFEEIKQ